jgi:hypothetical protein
MNPLDQYILDMSNVVVQNFIYFPIQLFVPQAYDFGHNQERDPLSLLDGGNMVFQNIFENYHRIGLGIIPFNISEQILFDVVNEKVQDLPLALEMPIYRTLGNPDLFGNLSYGDVFTAKFDNQFSKGVYNLLPTQ